MIDVRIDFTEYDDLGRPFGTDGIISLMDRHDIDQAILIPRMAVDSDFRQGNKDLFQAILCSDRLLGYLVVNLNYPQESIQLMRSAMTSPKFAALGIFGGASKPYLNLEDSADILNAYRRFVKPVFLNIPNAAAVEEGLRIAKEFPTIKFLLGNMGGDDWKSTLACTRQLNMLFDISGSFDAEKIDAAMVAFGPNRLIFGSGAPRSDVSSMLGLLNASGISEANMKKILHDNAAKLFNIDA
jgi:predicted TIM-barrel fold metal-dependent hydrolase